MDPIEPTHIHLNNQWVFWLATGGISIIFFLLWFWVKRWIGEMDIEKEAWKKEGGLLTRDKFFEWCQNNREGCPAGKQIKAMMEWKNGVLEDGGFMPREEHTQICKEITREISNHFTDRIKELFDNHRQWVAQELKLITKEQEVLNKLVREQIKTESGRWDGHDEQTRLKK